MLKTNIIKNLILKQKYRKNMIILVTSQQTTLVTFQVKINFINQVWRHLWMTSRGWDTYCHCPPDLRLQSTWPRFLRPIFVACNQFHQHLASSFWADFLWPKNYKPKLYAHKRCAKQFCTQKLLLKCWWNWHLSSLDFGWHLSDGSWQSGWMFIRQSLHFRPWRVWPVGNKNKSSFMVIAQHYLWSP